MRLPFRYLFLALLTLTAGVFAQEPPARVTILYDAIGKTPGLKLGWGGTSYIYFDQARAIRE